MFLVEENTLKCNTKLQIGILKLAQSSKWHLHSNNPLFVKSKRKRKKIVCKHRSMIHDVGKGHILRGNDPGLYPVGCWTSLIRYGIGSNQWTPPPTCCCDAASFGCRTSWRRRVCQRICTGNAVECGTRPRQEIAFFELGGMCCSVDVPHDFFTHQMYT